MIDLMQFVSTRNTRYAMCQPWVASGCKYATDGRIILKLPTPEADSLPDGKTPPVDKLFDKMVPEHCTADYATAGKFVDCKIECSECFGSGGHDCETCHQWVDCATCSGQCDTDGKARELITGFRIQDKYDKLLLTLPGLKYDPAVVIRRPMFFVFDGGCGAVMPLDTQVQSGS